MLFYRVLLLALLIPLSLGIFSCAEDGSEGDFGADGSGFHVGPTGLDGSEENSFGAADETAPEGGAAPPDTPDTSEPSNCDNLEEATFDELCDPETGTNPNDPCCIAEKTEPSSSDEAGTSS